MTGRRKRQMNFSMVILGVLIATTFFGRWASAQTNGPGSYNPKKFTDEQFVLYEKQLNALLLTRRDEEKLFVHQVVERVKVGIIPAKLVQTSYGWVRNRRPNTKYPFVFFEQVLRLQGKKAGLPNNAIPPFDFDVYRKLITPRK